MKLGKKLQAMVEPVITGSCALEAIHAGFRSAQLAMDDLQAELGQRKSRKASLTMKMHRSSEAEDYIQRGPPALPSIDDAQLKAITAAVIANHGVDRELLRSLREKAFRPRMKEAGDFEQAMEYQDEVAAIELLEQAIKVLRKDLVTQKAEAIRLAGGSIKAERQQIISQLAEALAQLSGAIANEKRLYARLAAADAELPKLVRPRLFPVDILSNIEVLEWAQQAIAEGMLATKQCDAIMLDTIDTAKEISA